MRASVLDQYAMDYVITARAKGLTERQIARRHVLRHAALPVLTMAGVQFGALFGGAVVVETVFGWPGLGLLAYESLFARDINLLLGIFFISACLVVVVNLLVDLAYVLFDPRIELR
jgi:peptide/nickel transport system permease protein